MLTANILVYVSTSETAQITRWESLVSVDMVMFENANRGAIYVPTLVKGVD